MRGTREPPWLPFMPPLLLLPPLLLGRGRCCLSGSASAMAMLPGAPAALRAAARRSGWLPALSCRSTLPGLPMMGTGTDLSSINICRQVAGAAAGREQLWKRWAASDRAGT